MPGLCLGAPQLPAFPSCKHQTRSRACNRCIRGWEAPQYHREAEPGLSGRFTDLFSLRARLLRGQGRLGALWKAPGVPGMLLRVIPPAQSRTEAPFSPGGVCDEQIPVHSAGR